MKFHRNIHVGMDCSGYAYIDNEVDGRLETVDVDGRFLGELQYYNGAQEPCLLVGGDNVVPCERIEVKPTWRNWWIKLYASF